MKLKFSLPLLLSLMVCLPALSQESLSSVLSGIIAAGNDNTATNATAMSDALNFVGSSADVPASPLDFITGASVEADPVAALVGLYSPQGSASPLGALDVISGAYDNTGFYMTGVFDTMNANLYESSVVAPVSGMSFYSPEWGRITSGFGYRPLFKREHKGIDVAMNVGDTVRAALPGVVQRVAYEAKGYGHYIILRHDDGMETRYAHLSKPLASVGERVMSGQAIALSGNTGNSTGPHLHFETRYKGVAIDPASVFNLSGGFRTQYENSAGTAPASSTAMATGFNGSKKSLAGKSTYVVREGDTPKKIAERAKISVLRLCQLNFITENDKLQPGTMLKLK